MLGLTQVEVATVHSDLAEQAFKSQVQQVMGEGALTPDRLAGLEAVRQRMGLPKETADKVLKGFQNQKLIAGMQVGSPGGRAVGGWLGVMVLMGCVHRGLGMPLAV